MNFYELYEYLMHLRDANIKHMKYAKGSETIITQNAIALKMAADRLMRQYMKLAAMYYDLKNVRCKNCANRVCGRAEEPCKSCGIRELKWEWDAVKKVGAEDGKYND